MATPEPSGGHLTRWDRAGLAALTIGFVLLGVITEVRGAFLQRRMGDFEVYARTAWAVRCGRSIYEVTDHNGWHYHYPPLFAILLTPLADPPPGEDRSWTLPYSVSVGAWYLLNLGFLAWGVDRLARALQEASPALRSLPAGSRRWWGLRVLPVAACLPAIGHTLSRGQVTVLLLALLCAMTADLLRGRRGRAGLWLAGAICLKVIPVFLLLIPLARRDGRCLAGCGVGLLLGLGVIPVVALGTDRTVSSYREWFHCLILPAVANGEDRSRAEELLNVTATPSQSFLTVFHNTLHPERGQRPSVASPAVRRAHWLTGAALAMITILVARRHRHRTDLEMVLLIGAMAMLMVLLSPVCHAHYFAVALLVAAGLLARQWAEDRPLGSGWMCLAGLYLAGNAVPLLPGMERVRDLGLAMYANLFLWLIAVRQLSRPPSAGLPGRCLREQVSGSAA